MDYNNVNYQAALSLIQEGDVLLFRGHSFSARWITWVRGGMYSHAALASWRLEGESPLLECVEFREWKGGRTVNLKHEVEKYSGRIDVYRPCSKFLKYVVKRTGQDIIVVEDWVEYDGRKVTDTMRQMTGLPYGWHRIWLLARYHLPGLRFWFKPNIDDKSDNGGLYPVCSTAVAASIRRNFVDPTPNLADYEMLPDDLGRSAIFNYILTLVK